MSEPSLETVKVGVHSSNWSLFILRRRGVLEELLKPLGARVEWVDYEGGPNTIPLLAEGRIEFAGTGSTPPITAQSKGIDIVYAAASEPRPDNGRFLTRDSSPVSDVASLRGKRVGIGVGSWHTHFLTVALDQAGLTNADVTIVDTRGRSGRALLLDDQIDAWLASGPDLAEVQPADALREIVKLDSVVSNRSIWYATRDLAENRPHLLDAVVKALKISDDWIAANPEAAAEILARDNARKSTKQVWVAAVESRPWGPHPITGDFIEEQQRGADLLFRQGVIPAAVDISRAVVAPAASLIGKAA